MRRGLRVRASLSYLVSAAHVGRTEKPVLQVAVEGCCHGDLDKIYGTMQQLERMDAKKIDLLICCGDFQARRLLLSAHQQPESKPP